MQKNQFIDIDNARQNSQRQVMRQILSAGHCPFCLENLHKYHQHPILKDGRFWILTKNKWPYPHTRNHYLAIYKAHAEKLADLDPQAGQELIELVQYLEKMLHAPGGGIAMRFGNTDYSAGTVAHLHVQFLVPAIDEPDFVPCRIKIGKDREKRIELSTVL